ncbi:MAG: sulfatase [Planctomycetaceae bacterium]|nr:sulfatase [Planctomycetaceae bacterium]
MQYELTSELTRRGILKSAACGFGSVALSGIAQAESTVGLHHAPRAKRVIFLFMHGGPSHVDTFDYKPELQKRSGQRLPFAPAKNLDPTATNQAKLLGSPWKFQQHGDSGLWVSSLFPEVAKYVDDLCVIRSVQSKGQSHGQAVCMLHTGTDNFVRPSVGSWVSYGLATANRDLPTFVSISPAAGHGGPRNYGPAFLPAAHQATTIGQNGKLPADATFKFLKPLSSDSVQARKLAFLQQINRKHFDRTKHKPIEGMIRSMEMAFRMQSSAPPVIDMSEEPEHIRKQYGIGEKATDNYGRQCLLARRFAEAGVRHIQVSTPNVWDQHSNLQSGHTKNSLAVDKPIAGLLGDLKQRGLLDDTLVVWSGEFGRTPIVQGSNGRDHNPQGFTVWMAGGGVKGGITWGQTDEFGYFAVQDRVHMHDLHATMLHLMGIDHERLTYRYAGRDFRLTDVHGEVVHDIMA